MRSRGDGGAKPRHWVWLGGALMGLAYYFLNSIPQPQRTTVGTERRLFGLGDLNPTLLEAPSGGRWILVTPQPERYMPAPVPGNAAPGGPPSGIPGPTWCERLQGFRWPNDERAPRTLTLS